MRYFVVFRITWNASWILQEGLFECIHCRNHNRPLFNSFPAPRLLCDKNDKVEDGLHSQADIPRSSGAARWRNEQAKMRVHLIVHAEYSSGIRFIKETKATRERKWTSRGFPCKSKGKCNLFSIFIRDQEGYYSIHAQLQHTGIHMSAILRPGPSIGFRILENIL